MRWYCVDELTPEMIDSLAAIMQGRGWTAGMDGLYWLPLPEDLLSPIQREHLCHCGPFALAVELEAAGLRVELLVRARGRLRCDCIAQAGPEVMTHAVQVVDEMLSGLGEGAGN